MITPTINLQLVDFPVRGDEMIFPNEDGSYTVFINAKLSYIGRMKAYEHALKHIENGDFGKNNVQEIESEAHGK